MTTVIHLSYNLHKERRTLIIFGFNHDSLDKNGVSEQECLQALADPLKVEVEEDESVSGNPRSIWVGKTHQDRLLEVGVEYLEHTDWIYHANNAQSKYRELYEQSR